MELVRRWYLPRFAWSTVTVNPALLRGCVVCVLMLCVAIAGPLLMVHDAQSMTADVLHPPSLVHWLGTDSVGRDMLARVIAGARYSLTLAAIATIIALSIGAAAGISAAYFGGRVDWTVMRLIEIILSVPALLIAIVVLAAMGPSPGTLLFVLVVAHVPQTVRVARSGALQVKTRPFIDAAKISRVSSFRIMKRHVLPNVRGLLIVQATVVIAHVLLIETVLSFLGLGVQPPNPSLGFMVAEGRQWMELAPWAVLAPGLVIVLAVAGFTMLGNGIDKAFVSVT